MNVTRGLVALYPPPVRDRCATLASGHDRAAGITTGCALLALAIATTGTVRDLAEVS